MTGNDLEEDRRDDGELDVCWKGTSPPYLLVARGLRETGRRIRQSTGLYHCTMTMMIMMTVMHVHARAHIHISIQWCDL